MKGSSRDHDLLLSLPEMPLLPLNIDRRSFLMRNAVIGAAAVMTGTVWTPEARAQQAAKEAATPPLGATLSPDLDVVKQAKGPVMTVVDEFYKVGPGPSSSHTIGPMRITYDFYQRCTKLPADQLAKATGPQGAPVRQPERHRQGARHRARVAGGPHRQGAGHRRSAVPRRDDRQAGADLSGEAR